MNWRKIRARDVFSPKKWLIVADAYKNKLQGVSLERCRRALEIEIETSEFTADFWCRRVMGKPLEYARIVCERADRCAQCVIDGSCVHCGCTVPENMYSLINQCSAGNWTSAKLTNE